MLPFKRALVHVVYIVDCLFVSLGFKRVVRDILYKRDTVKFYLMNENGARNTMSENIELSVDTRAKH